MKISEVPIQPRFFRNWFLAKSPAIFIRNIRALKELERCASEYLIGAMEGGRQY
jgi:hypothetical protein